MSLNGESHENEEKIPRLFYLEISFGLVSVLRVRYIIIPMYREIPNN